MNKSKFLKKSLAMVLAIMMVVAMIPLSASAASVLYFTVNNADATVTNTEITAKVSSTTGVKLAAEIEGDWDTVSYVGKADTDPIPGPIATIPDLAAFADKSGNTYTLSLKLSSAIEGSDDVTGETYTIKLTVDESAVSGDATISRVTGITGTVGNPVVSANTITITMPYGAEAPEIATENIVTTVEGATPTVSDDFSTVTVEAPNGNTRVYDVKVVYQAGFTAFSIEGQTKSTISNEDTTVTVNTPYGFDRTKEVVTTFTHGSNIKKVTLSDETTEIESGAKLKYEGDVTLYLWIDAENYVPTTVTLETVDENPEAAITEIKVDIDGLISNSTAVSGETVTVEMPATTDFTAAEAAAATVYVTASAGSQVSIPTQEIVVEAGDADENNVYTLDGVDVKSQQSFKIKVVSQDGKTTKYYTVNLTKAAASEAKITDVTLKSDDATYTATISGETITLTVPYGVQDEETLEGFTLYLTKSVGSLLYVGDGPDPVTDLPIKNVAAAQEDGIVPAFGEKLEYTVVSDDDSWTTYTFEIKTESAKLGRTISAATNVNTANVAKITSDGTFTGTVKTVYDKDDTDTKLYGIEYSVPYSYDATTDLAFSKLTLSDGAKAYTDDTFATEITALDPEKEGDQAVATVKIPAFDKSEAVDGNYDLDTAAKIYVVSEKYNVNIDPDAAKVNCSVYYLYGVKKAPQTGYTLSKVSSTLDENVTVQLSGETVTFTVPNSYAGGDDSAFTFDYTVSPQAKMLLNSKEGAPVVGDKGDAEVAKEDTTTKFTVDGDGALFAGATAVNNFTVVAEDEKNSKNYAVKVVVKDAETGAELTSAKVNNTTASISGKKVTVTLPFNSDLTNVTLDLAYSPMATVLVNDEPYDPEATYDLTSEIEIWIVSEDGKTANTYTLTAGVSDQFNDVDPDDWFYDYVMQAAAAGWVQGDGKGNFLPRNNVTRQDFSVMFVRMLGVDVSSYTTSAFKDVSADHYASAAIAYLAEQGIVNGDANGNFRPTAFITRQEAAKILAEGLNLTGTTDKVFTDADKIAAWAKPYVDACVAAGVMGGDTAGTFRPTANITRAEAAKVIVDGAKVK